MSIVFYGLTTLVGVIPPFFIKDGEKMIKRKFIMYAISTASAATLILLVYLGKAGLPSFGKPEAAAIGVLVMTLSICYSKINRIVNPERIEKNHHRKEHRKAA